MEMVFKTVLEDKKETEEVAWRQIYFMHSLSIQLHNYLLRGKYHYLGDGALN